MKSALTLLALLLSCSLAQAETLTSESCGTGQTAVCQAPAPDVSVITYQYVYGYLTVVVDGVTYTAVAPRYATSYVGTVYAQGGATKDVDIVFAVKSVRGAGARSNVLQWTLASGTVE